MVLISTARLSWSLPFAGGGVISRTFEAGRGAGDTVRGQAFVYDGDVDARHLAFAFNENVAARGNRVALRHKVEGAWRDISWRALGEEVHAVARALVALGVAEGETVGLLAPNRPEWTIADLAIQQIRAVSVPIHTTSTGPQAAWILRDAGVKVLFVGGRDGHEKIQAVRGELPALGKVVVLDEAAARAAPEAISWKDLVTRGRGAEGAAHEAELEARLRRASPDDLLTLIYTSGTTGEPKGVMLTHGNFSTTAQLHDERLIPLGEDDVSLCFLPLSHVFERAWTSYVLHRGMVNCYCEDPAKVIEILPEVRPTAMCAVPRLYEKIYANILHRLESASPARRRLFWWAFRAGSEAAACRREERPLPLGLRIRHAVADRLVLGKVRAIVGGRIRLMPCAGAAISKEIEEFFHAAGLFLCQGYGLTETTATVSCHEMTRFRTGTVGKPLPGVEVRIADDGEILVRGETVMKGYYNKPEATAAVFRDGWFRTGDAGVLHPDGILQITERIKDLFKTSGGKYIAPQLIESTVGADLYVEQLIVFGDNRRYVSALIVPAFEALSAWARSAGIPFGSREELLARPEVLAFYRQRIDERVKDLSHLEQIARFTLLPTPLTIEGGEITATLKVRRRVAAAKYRDEIEAMYPEG